MARSFYRATPTNMVEQFDAELHHEPSGRTYQMVRRGDRFFMIRFQTGFGGRRDNIFEAEIHYVIGSGNHARTYVHRTAENRLVQLPVSWYRENGGYFAMSPGYDHASHLDFRRKITYDCIFCHNAYPDVPAGGDLAGADPVYPTTLPEGIDCQRCHGPGGAHVSAAQQKLAPEQIRAAIVNPARLSFERQLEVCLQCHLETTSFPLPNSIQRFHRGAFSYRPGEPLADYMLHFDHAPGSGREDKFEIVSAAYRLFQSACFQRSDRKLLCTTCHNPHDIPRGAKAVAHYSRVCRSCHEPALTARIRSGGHPHAAECLSCHMPKRRTEDVVHAVMTDHAIVRRKPARDLLAPLAERREVEGVSYRGEVVLHYPRALPPSPERDLYLAFAQVAQKSNMTAGIRRLEEALQRHQPREPQFYFELGWALAEDGSLGRAVDYYRAALERDPDFVPALRGLGAALIKLGRPDEAIGVLENALALDHRDPATLSELARARYRSGRLDQAIAALEQALGLDPDLVEAHDLLGSILLESGRLERAETAVREALRRQPDLASAHVNLGNLLVARGRVAEAEYHFYKAVALAPSLAVARYSLGALLAGGGRFDEAGAQIAAALELNPNFAEAHEVQGNLRARKGDWRRAVDSYRQALRLRPGFGRARVGLGLALAATGDLEGARAQLAQAASDPDISVRSEAADLLASLSESSQRKNR